MRHLYQRIDFVNDDLYVEMFAASFELIWFVVVVQG